MWTHYDQNGHILTGESAWTLELLEKVIPKETPDLLFAVGSMKNSNHGRFTFRFLTFGILNLVGPFRRWLLRLLSKIYRTTLFEYVIGLA
tara:strand:- start:744 stop:1013 length:270 start_codon:yes stop_codon:yes gene_type:complete